MGETAGLVTHYVLFAMSIVERSVHIAGITSRRDEAWRLQVGRHLLDAQGGALDAKRDAHARLGRRPEALAVYQRCRQSLLTRQGVSPTPETQVLYQQLANR